MPASGIKAYSGIGVEYIRTWLKVGPNMQYRKVGRLTHAFYNTEME